MTEVAPLSPPTIRVRYTGFVVSVKLTPVAFAWKAYCSVAVGVIRAVKFTPLITSVKKKDPSGCFVKEWGGIVMEKVPIWSVTWSRWGWIAGAVLLKVNWE